MADKTLREIRRDDRRVRGRSQVITYRTLADIARDPRVIEIDIESGGTSDARYVYTVTLVLGWQADGCHYPTENSVRELIKTMKALRPCACDECGAEKGGR
jgi:hypothetical protein